MNNNYKIGSTKGKFNQDIIREESKSENDADYVCMEDQFKSLMNMISQVNFELGPNEENVGKVTLLFDQFTIFCENGAPIINLPITYLKLFFSLPNMLQNNDSAAAYALYVSMSKFLLEFSKRSDLECCTFAETNYIHALLDIASFSRGTFAIYNALSSIANLLYQKPMTGGNFPHIRCYEVIHNIKFSAFDKRNIQFYDLQIIKEDCQKTIVQECATLDVLYNLMIFLPLKFDEILKAIPGQNRRNIATYLHQVFHADKGFTNYEKEIFVLRGVNIFWRIFYYGSVSLQKEFETLEVLGILISELGRHTNNEIDQRILFCLTKIAASGGTQAKFTLNQGFSSYLPPKNDKKSIILFCKAWESIISSLGVKTHLLYSRPAGIKLLKSVSDNLIEAAQLLLSDEDFEILLETTLIFAAIINSRDNDLIEKVLMNCPNFHLNAQQTLEQQNPENAVKIIQAIATLQNYISANGPEKFTAVFNWLSSDELLVTLADTRAALSEYADIDAETMKLMMDIKKSNNESDE